MDTSPKISVITRTYNRAHILPRAIESVLRQDYGNWELIIVDDGSTDDISIVLSKYQDKRIKTIHHARNQGVTAAGNTGLDHMSGEWFTLLDSDDEMMPDALSTMVRVLDMDTAINAVTCNCIDFVTREFTGTGLVQDQYLDFPTMVACCRGEHWGITKASLLEGRRFNPEIVSESILWYKIGRTAKRYYIHKGLRIYHTEGQDRVLKPRVEKVFERKKVFYLAHLGEGEYLDILRNHAPSEYSRFMFHIALFSIMEGDKSTARRCFRELRRHGSWARMALVRVGLILGMRGTSIMYRAMSIIRQ